MLDIVIISVPGTMSQAMPAAPAILKASVEQAGFSCKTIDFNIQFYHHPEYSEALEGYYTTGLDLTQEETGTEIIKVWAQQLAKINPKYIGISVFTYQNRIATKLFCQFIRQFTTSKIILGGQGLADGGIESTENFGKRLCEQGLADYYIRSEGEISLVELLKGNTTHPGICSNTFAQVENLDLLPYPDYSDYNIELYATNRLPITGSRGCVRACTFCDIHEHWKFRYRSGENIVQEMIHLHKQYGVRDFNFTDSLVNGNYKEFSIFIKLLSAYNKTIAEPITWAGQFIVRSIGQSTDEYWRLISESGGNKLAIGVETGSDAVRSHMNKKFNNAELDHTMSMMDKYNISCDFLMIVGYPTETEQDFQHTLDMFTRYKHLANRIISNITVGSTLGILPGTPLYKNAEIYNIELDKFENNWVANDNPTLTIEARLERRKRLYAHLTNLGYHLKKDAAKPMLDILESNLEMFNKRLSIKKIIKIRAAK